MSNFLDNYLIVNIVSRLPFESVSKCRCVCKSWRALLHEHYFNQIYTDKTLQKQQHIDDRSPVSLFILSNPKHISHTNNYECHLHDYYYHVNYDDERVSSSSHKVINSPLINPLNTPSIKWSVIGSSNGLICLYGFLYKSDPALIIIYNPITSEYLDLPVLAVDADADDDDDVKDGRFNFMVAIGFGYHPSTKEYKIVRIIHHQRDNKQTMDDDDSYDRWLHIYTLGSRGKWRIRKVGVPPVTSEISDNDSFAKGKLANGAIYWLTRSDTTIVSFDLEDEKFRIIQSPASAHDPHDYPHYVLEGGERLYFVVYDQTQFSSTIYILMNNNNNRDQYSWSKEFSIPLMSGSGLWVTPIAPGTGAGRDRVVCVCNRSTSLISFDRRTKTFESLGDIGGNYWFNITCYTKSLVSLKALGEEDAKVISTKQPAVAAAYMKTLMIKRLGFAMVISQLLQLIMSTSDLMNHWIRARFRF